MFAKPTPSRVRVARAGFSLVELLIALTISSVILTALMAALNSSFQAYQNTTEAVSTHVIARNTMARITAMIRFSNNVRLIGSDGNTYPPIITGTGRNIAGASISAETDYAALAANVTARGIRIDLGNVLDTANVLRRRWATFRIVPEQTSGTPTSYAVEYREDLIGPSDIVSTGNAILLRGLKRARFEMDFDIFTARLERATIDFALAPNDFDDAIDYINASGTPAYAGNSFTTNLETEHIRLIGSASPRRFED